MILTPITTAEFFLVGAAYIPSLVGMAQQRRYLRENPQIQSEADMEHYKSFVRAQMYLAMIFIACGGPAFLLILADQFMGGYQRTITESLLLAAPYMPFFFTGKISKNMERQIKNPSRCAPQFAEEFDYIGFAWKKQLIPKF